MLRKLTIKNTLLEFGFGVKVEGEAISDSVVQQHCAQLDDLSHGLDEPSVCECNSKIQY